ncbi:jg18994 [Pararge aegeria aegeria]|uniref:Jg18994 protein n=1 Tax=Pararge aegeria aegeria TaxID=348720 RepID=A0A8S4RH58_9NEOP|nr:jg18994 [Pararge aegeria aegeria]
MGKGRQGFIERNCTFTNCFVKANRTYFNDYIKFDVILFSANELHAGSYSLPETRSSHQKYVFASIESVDNYPVCTNNFDGFFNWTWTYRLQSKAKWGYIAIRDSKNNLIGPEEDMNWIKLEDMDPVSDGIKDKIRNKTKAAGWLVSNCYSRSGREIFFEDLQNWLTQHGHKVDIYGQCDVLICKTEKVYNK